MLHHREVHLSKGLHTSAVQIELTIADVSLPGAPTNQGKDNGALQHQLIQVARWTSSLLGKGTVTGELLQFWELTAVAYLTLHWWVSVCPLTIPFPSTSPIPWLVMSTTRDVFRTCWRKCVRCANKRDQGLAEHLRSWQFPLCSILDTVLKHWILPRHSQIVKEVLMLNLTCLLDQ